MEQLDSINYIIITALVTLFSIGVAAMLRLFNIGTSEAQRQFIRNKRRARRTAVLYSHVLHKKGYCRACRAQQAMRSYFINRFDIDR